MTQTHIDVAARAAKISLPISDVDFPIAAIPPKGSAGSAKAKVALRLRTPDGIELLAEASVKGLQRALEAAQAAPGGHWVAQGRLVSGCMLEEVGVVYQPPSSKLTTTAEP